MPEDNADLATVEVDFARLPGDSPASCPVPMNEVLEYLAMEVPDGASLQADGLEFVRTARVEDTDYWIWSFSEPDGQPAYVTVFVNADGTTTVGYEANEYELRPEQFILGDYHQVF